jgi:preprotein translocase subunit YajC
LVFYFTIIRSQREQSNYDDAVMLA